MCLRCVYALIDWPSCSSVFVIFTETEPGLHTLGSVMLYVDNGFCQHQYILRCAERLNPTRTWFDFEPMALSCRIPLLHVYRAPLFIYVVVLVLLRLRQL